MGARWDPGGTGFPSCLRAAPQLVAQAAAAPLPASPCLCPPACIPLSALSFPGVLGE